MHHNLSRYGRITQFLLISFSQREIAQMETPFETPQNLETLHILKL